MHRTTFIDLDICQRMIDQPFRNLHLDIDLVFQGKQKWNLLSRKQRELSQTITINTWRFSNTYLSKSNWSLRCSCWFFLHLYGTRRRVTLVKALCITSFEIKISIISFYNWNRETSTKEIVVESSQTCQIIKFSPSSEFQTYENLAPSQTNETVESAKTRDTVTSSATDWATAPSQTLKDRLSYRTISDSQSNTIIPSS